MGHGAARARGGAAASAGAVARASAYQDSYDFPLRLLSPSPTPSRGPSFQAIDTQLGGGIDGGLRRFTELVLNEQPLPVASMKSSSSQDATSATRSKISLAAMGAVATRALMAP